jgi:parvulin-like peptidyl-prolyl isomerase
MSRQAAPTRPSKSRESKSAAVRAALANPSRRQLSKWQRERRQRLAVLYVAAGLIVLTACVLAFGYWREMLVRPNEPAATVGDQTVSVAALAQRLKPQLAALDMEIARLQSQLPFNASGSPGADPASRQVQMLYNQRLGAMDQVLTDLIDDELVVREAQRRNLTVTPDEIEARINSDFAKQRAGAAAPAPTQVAAPAAGPTPSPTPPPTLTASEFQETYQSLLQRIGYTDEQYRRYIEAQVLRDKVRDAVGASIAPVQEQVHVRRITVATQEEATAALAQIRSGETPMEDLAREKSLDLLSKNEGGDLGWLPRGIDSTPFDEQAFRLAIGEISEPFVTPTGWEILQVLEKGERPLRPEHQDRLKQRAFDDWLRRERDDPTVRRDLDRDKRDWVMRQAGGQGAGRRAASPGGAPMGF